MTEKTSIAQLDFEIERNTVSPPPQTNHRRKVSVPKWTHHPLCRPPNDTPASVLNLANLMKENPPWRNRRKNSFEIRQSVVNSGARTPLSNAFGHLQIVRGDRV
jgi:hypothetical protein